MDHVSYAHVFAAGVRLLRRPKKGLAKGAAKDEEETVYVGPDGKEYRSLRLVKRIIDGTHYKKFDGDDEDEGHSGKTPAKRYRRHSGEPRDARTDETKSPVVSPLLAQAKSEVPFDETTRLGTSDQRLTLRLGGNASCWHSPLLRIQCSRLPSFWTLWRLPPSARRPPPPDRGGPKRGSGPQRETKCKAMLGPGSSSVAAF